MSLELNALTAVSPLDGRYRKKVESLSGYFSELGLIKYRVLVEVAWLKSLTQSTDLTEIKKLSKDAIKTLDEVVEKFSIKDAERIKAIEATTNHDVKAVEYWLRETLKSNKEISEITGFIHFACTSEDINNVSHALMIRDARDQVLIPTIEIIIESLTELSRRYAGIPMLSRTHGQAASPSTMGKEIANVVYRLRKQSSIISKIRLPAKMNGAVGNYNAHLSAFPDYDWEKHTGAVLDELDLDQIPYTTQIEPHDGLAEIFDGFTRLNTILIDFCRDIWAYISVGYFKQKIKAGEVGSSTMPHKVNPIDFENAEGNLGLSSAMLKHLSGKLPISRWQRDLTDSTVLRNMGVGLAYALLAFDSLQRGIKKLDIDEVKIRQDLDQSWDVLAEPVQTVMKLYGIEDAYEQLKELTRGKGGITRENIQQFIGELQIPEEAKRRLLSLEPASYTGIAENLAKNI